MWIQARCLEKKSAVVFLLSFFMASSGGQASQGGLGGFEGLPRPHGGRGGLGVGGGGEDQGDFEGFAPMSNFSYAVGSRARIDTRPLASAAKTEVRTQMVFGLKFRLSLNFFAKQTQRSSETYEKRPNYVYVHQSLSISTD